ncbi:uncharacterized protein LOC134253321 [Saccostrea cucullata]|uniref:uncharacterized protein LOC134253321 n=1 Tax=Saccostrea cuccullata TaxID=36930 RepID=UPI002ED097DF
MPSPNIFTTETIQDLESSNPGTSGSVDSSITPQTEMPGTSTEQETPARQKRKRPLPGKGKGKSKCAKKVKYPCGECSKECVEDCVACDGCDTWFHGRCVDLPDLETISSDMWFCPDCSESVTSD